jgi:hypothetical protein
MKFAEASKQGNTLLTGKFKNPSVLLKAVDWVFI